MTNPPLSTFADFVAGLGVMIAVLALIVGFVVYLFRHAERINKQATWGSPDTRTWIDRPSSFLLISLTGFGERMATEALTTSRPTWDAGRWLDLIIGLGLSLPSAALLLRRFIAYLRRRAERT
jgi:hypothetical protein